MATNPVSRRGRVCEPRPLRIEGDFAYVPLTRGKEATISAEDAALVGSMNWSLTSNGYAHCVRNDGTGRPTNYFMHRVITGALAGISVDHIDGDTLNNTRPNLRLCSHAENLANRGAPSGNKTGFKGVSICAQTNRFRAQLRVNGKVYRLGRFDSAEEAARAYDATAKKLLGEFARLNFG